MNKKAAIKSVESEIAYQKKVLEFISGLEKGKIYHFSWIESIVGNYSNKAMVGRLVTFNTESVCFDILAALDHSVQNWGRHGEGKFTLKFSRLFNPKYYRYTEHYIFEEVTDPADMVKYITWPCIYPAMDKVFNKGA
jgi:hypothetical protein